MEVMENGKLTGKEYVRELVRLLYEHNMEEAADDLFQMAVCADAMGKKLESVLKELEAVRGQIHKMEEKEEAEKGLKQALGKAVSRLEQDCQTMKEKLSEIKAEIRAKAGEIVTAAKQKGKSALNKASEFLGIAKKLQNICRGVQASIEGVDQSIRKIDAFGAGMREAGRKIANTFRTLADRPEKEYGEKRFSKTELIKKSFRAKKAAVRHPKPCRRRHRKNRTTCRRGETVPGRPG